MLRGLIYKKMKFFYKSMCCVFLMTLFFISQTSFAQSEDFETWKKQFKERKRIGLAGCFAASFPEQALKSQ